MKLAIIGTHSTGKTTLIRCLTQALETEGLSVAVLPEFARLCPFPIDEGTSFDAQAWIQEQQILEEQKHENAADILICDRATLDNFAYMHRACHETHDLSDYELRAAEHMRSYGGIFKTFQMPIKAEDDGKRPVDSATYELFRTEIDELIHHFLDKHEIHFHLLPQSIEYEVHVEEIMQALQLPTSVRQERAAFAAVT